MNGGDVGRLGFPSSPLVRCAGGAGPREGAYLRVPDVDTLVEGAAGQVAAVGAEGHAVDGLLVLGERVDADAALHVPQPHRRVERRAARGNAHVVHW